MGVNKKKSSQYSNSKSQYNKGVKKEEIKKTPPSKSQQKQKLSVLIEEAQGLKTLDSMKAITVHSFARTSGVKISVANNFLKNLENKNIIKVVGGYSGHRIYQKSK
jgi:small subunit ribosomal protein S25e